MSYMWVQLRRISREMVLTFLPTSRAENGAVLIAKKHGQTQNASGRVLLFYETKF